MRTIQSIPSLNPSANLCDLLQAATSAGHVGVELSIDSADSAAYDTGSASGHTGELLLRWSSANDAYGGLDAIDDSLRHQSVHRFYALLRIAGRVGVSMVTIGGVAKTSVAASSDASQGAYADRLYALIRSVRRVAEHAELDGVRIAIEPACDGLLLSPVELRDLIESVNSPFVGACLDVARLATMSWPADWIHTLRHRVWLVRRPGAVAASAHDGHPSWPACEEALGDIAFDGLIAVADDDRLSPNVVDQRRRSADVRDDDLAGKR